MDATVEYLLDLERRRCAAISVCDAATLRDLLSDDYVHVHTTGKIDDLDGHLTAIAEHPRQPERHELRVRLYGDVAVMVGVQVSRSSDAAMIAVMTQVAVRRDGRWRFVSAHVTRRDDAA